MVTLVDGQQKKPAPIGGQLCSDCFHAFVDMLATTWLGISQSGASIPECWKSGLLAILENASTWTYELLLLTLNVEAERIREFVIRASIKNPNSRRSLMQNTAWIVDVVSMWSRRHLETSLTAAAA